MTMANSAEAKVPCWSKISYIDLFLQIERITIKCVNKYMMYYIKKV